MPVWTDKKYKLVKSENFEELLLVMGISYFNRKLAKTLIYTCHLTQELDGCFTFYMVAAFHSIVLTFKPGEEFDETTSDGRLVRSSISFVDDNKFVQVQTPRGPSGDVMTITREFSDEELLITTEYRGVVTKRYYKAL